MKRAKVLELLREARELERSSNPVLIDSLAIDFVERKVTFRGRVIYATTLGINFPMLSTDHIIVPKDGEVL